MKNCKRFKPCYYCKGLHNSVICFQKDAKGDSPKLAEENKQDEKLDLDLLIAIGIFSRGKH